MYLDIIEGDRLGRIFFIGVLNFGKGKRYNIEI